MVLLAILIVIQFIRPERNESGDTTNDVSKKYNVPQDVQLILKNACNDCHSNKTVYPWYSNIQPVAWWLANHVNEGKRHLNFSDFTTSPIAIQNHKFEEVTEVMEEGEMPLASYTYFGLHPEANLSETQVQVLIGWAKSQMDLLKEQYPADSLVMPRRR